MIERSVARLATCLLLAGWLGGCEPPEPGPQGDSHTNWLRSCESDTECGTLQCLCGVCTAPCSTDDACSAAPGSSCLAAADPGAIATCAGKRPPAPGMCLPVCSAEGGCGDAQQCVAGACQPSAAPTSRVAVDASVELQHLTGLGATVGYAEDDIARFPDPAALEQAMFSGLGLDVLRFRNRHAEVSEPVLRRAAELVAAGERSLGRTPLVLLSSWSPPAPLKQNGATFCNDPRTCTLKADADGGFDYAGLAAHWRASLDAYARTGFIPDYVGIQNNADWAPSGGAVFEACRFLPREGSASVLANGESVTVQYPGFDQAMTAVTAALADLPNRPRILAPELSSISGAKDYLTALDPTQVDAVAHHLYGADAAAVDLAGFRALAELGGEMRLPLFQTEMQAGGFDTAVLIHHAFVDGAASMYLQTALVGPLSGPAANPSALIGLGEDELVLQDPYFAISHFSRFTDPGWSRVAASTSTPGLLASAWLAPTRETLTIVLINATSDAQAVGLDLDDASVRSAELRRTVFDGSERFAGLDGWTLRSAVPLPPRSVATVVIQR
jgi:O-glycosyl hydrolase